MTSLVALLRLRRPSWPTQLVLAGVLVLGVSFALSVAELAPLMATTLGALVGGSGFVLGVSASISTFLERDAYADSDFYR